MFLQLLIPQQLCWAKRGFEVAESFPEVLLYDRHLLRLLCLQHGCAHQSSVQAACHAYHTQLTK